MRESMHNRGSGLLVTEGALHLGFSKELVGCWYARQYASSWFYKRAKDLVVIRDSKLHLDFTKI